MTDPPPPSEACLLDSSALAGRLAEWRQVVASATVREEVSGGMRLHFPAQPVIAARLAVLAAAEGSCCAPLQFILRLAGGDIVIEVTGPPGLAGLASQIAAG
ncbi:MAG: hypothetical protein U0237_15615 [Thermoleophilia bacterium]